MIELYFEDFPVGEVIEFGDVAVTAESIVEYAREFDPQPFHLDAEAARDSQAGGLIASGWHTAALVMRMCCDAFVLRSASNGGPGVEELNWLTPVRPGDRLHVRRTTTSGRPSKSRPGLGLVGFQLAAVNQRDETVMTLTITMMMGRRPLAEAAPW
jgi:acyl dehydratase